ncbi:CtsR family transcriptional regulator [Clostridium sp. MB40-C1]|uniref:CtsR family transcriptional regulator n=1 Tax=Clostridium sp. MB40-C1 TaxID=3070996 RepID=UPI0027E0AE51|nr:CtsR family transcriptional regulator [Clostridium sp. MB40-C1]WMJ80308.1 CtsR family transcriptional regulator [Clostridium sp. MB40-C1]
MPRLSDVIEEFIKELLEETGDSALEIGRNELANQFRCAPSQINYVLTTRFSTESGYYVESRRGGGGCIKITKIQYKNNEPLRKIIDEKIGNSITYENSRIIIQGLVERNIISGREGNIMKGAINDRTIDVHFENKNNIRAQILKAMLKVVLL